MADLTVADKAGTQYRWESVEELGTPGVAKENRHQGRLHGRGLISIGSRAGPKPGALPLGALRARFRSLDGAK